MSCCKATRPFRGFPGKNLKFNTLWDLISSILGTIRVTSFSQTLTLESVQKYCSVLNRTSKIGGVKWSESQRFPVACRLPVTTQKSDRNVCLVHSSIDFQIKSVKLNIISVGYPNKDERRKMSFITQSKTVLTRLIDTAFIRFYSTQTQCLFWGGAFMYVGVVFQSFNSFEKNKKGRHPHENRNTIKCHFLFRFVGKNGLALCTVLLYVYTFSISLPHLWSEYRSDMKEKRCLASPNWKTFINRKRNSYTELI